jgi:hypothetical protein
MTSYEVVNPITPGNIMAFGFQSIFPYLGITGQTLIDLDANKTGADDLAGELLVYAAEVGAAIEENGDLPEFPETLKKGTTEKISGVALASLKVANALLAFVRFQVSGKAGLALKYVNQALTQLLAGQPVAPVSGAF